MIVIIERDAMNTKQTTPTPFERLTLQGRRAYVYRVDSAPPMDYTRKLEYLELVAKHGLTAMAAAFVGVTPSQVEKARKADRMFDQACSDAVQVWVEENLLQAAIERAANGIEKPIMGGKFKDEVVGYERVYSDALMSQLLRAFHPAFKATTATTNIQAAGGVMIVPSAPLDVDEWERKFSPDSEQNS